MRDPIEDVECGRFYRHHQHDHTGGRDENERDDVDHPEDVQRDIGFAGHLSLGKHGYVKLENVRL